MAMGSCFLPLSTLVFSHVLPPRVLGADCALCLPQLEPRRGSSKTRRDKEKQSCKGCGETFNSITKRRHRCKLCGAVSWAVGPDSHSHVSSQLSSQPYSQLSSVMQMPGPPALVSALPRFLAPRTCRGPPSPTVFCLLAMVLPVAGGRVTVPLSGR